MCGQRWFGMVGVKPNSSDGKPLTDRAMKQHGRRLLVTAVNAIKKSNPDFSDRDNRAIGRLFATGKASEAYAYLPNQQAADSLTWAYIEAVEIRRTFDAEVAKSRRLLGTVKQQGQLDRLKSGLVAVEVFFRDLQRQPVGWVVSQQTVPAGELGNLFRSLLSARDLLEQQRRIALETPGRLGATRKLAPGAADLASIAWLAQEILKSTGKPNRRAVKLLAEVVLQREVKEDQVRKAEQRRLGRAWRQPPRKDNDRSPYAGIFMSSRRTYLGRARTAAVANQPRLIEQSNDAPVLAPMRGGIFNRPFRQ
jgi:hypothetical protein